MTLSYFDLLSPEPVCLQGIGKIVSPKLKEIAAIGNIRYQHYLRLFSMDFEDFPPLLLFSSPQLCELLENALNFFFVENIVFSEKYHCFFSEEDGKITGSITPENYVSVANVVCQRNGIASGHTEDFSKAKNKKALEIMKKLKRGRADRRKRTSYDNRLELGNIISSVANKSETLNILNIWELTIYQLWDCFSRLSHNNIYQIHAMSVATWGDKNHHFDATAWFKRIDMQN